MKDKDITIEDIANYQLQRGGITSTEYFVLMQMINEAKDEYDYNAIGKCLEILTRRDEKQM